jgi:hypothetical protein
MQKYYLSVFLSLEEEHRQRVFENTVLRRIFGLKMLEIRGGRRKLHTEELRNWYSTSNIVRIIKSRKVPWAGRVALMGMKRNARRNLVGNPEEDFYHRFLFIFIHNLIYYNFPPFDLYSRIPISSRSEIPNLFAKTWCLQMLFPLHLNIWL